MAAAGLVAAGGAPRRRATVRVVAWGAVASGLLVLVPYAAIAIAKSLFQKGASAASALAFQFASTNLVWELGLVLWVLIGWQFALAEYIGGLAMIALMWGMLRLFVSREVEERARAHAQDAEAGHQHPFAVYVFVDGEIHGNPGIPLRRRNQATTRRHAATVLASTIRTTNPVGPAMEAMHPTPVDAAIPPVASAAANRRRRPADSPKLCRASAKEPSPAVTTSTRATCRM